MKAYESMFVGSHEGLGLTFYTFLISRISASPLHSHSNIFVVEMILILLP